MSIENEIVEVEQQVETLETEVKKFADGFLIGQNSCRENFVGNAISENDIDTSYSYLLEQLKLKEETENLKLLLTTMLQMQKL